MPRETIQELVNFSPVMTQDHWDDLGTLARRHECIPAFLGHILAMAAEEAHRLVNISTATPEGQEEAAMIKGMARGYQALVGNACYEMGDKTEEEVEEQETEQEARPRRKRRAPAKRTTRRKK